MQQYFPFDVGDAESFLAEKLPPLIVESLSDGAITSQAQGGGSDKNTRESVVAPLERSQALSAAVIPLLHHLQDRYGYIDDQAVPILAELVNRSRAEIHGVVTFYHDFRRSPPAQTIVRICMAEACQAMGSDKLAESAKQQLGTDFHHNSADDTYRLEPVYCFGNCACAPSLSIDERLYARADAAKLKTWLQNKSEHHRAGRA